MSAIAEFKPTIRQQPSVYSRALVPHSNNYLLNPCHKPAKDATLTSCIAHPYDQRLFGYEGS